MATFAVHKRTFYKGGDRQPAVVRETHLSVRFRKVAGVFKRCDNEPRWSRSSESTGAYAPPLLVVLRYGHLPAKLRLVRYTNARLQERRPSARRGSGIAPAALSVSCRTRMFACHGELTPPLLAILRYGHLPTKLRLVQYTNARLQERRA
jgi:hypothetical protein